MDGNQAEGICVAIRMRPLNEREINGGQEAVFRCMTTQNSVVQLKDGQPVDTYFYDKVFDPNANTVEVYSHVARDIVKNVVSGINGTIFACK
jgi:kinesin family protein 5